MQRLESLVSVVDFYCLGPFRQSPLLCVWVGIVTACFLDTPLWAQEKARHSDTFDSNSKISSDDIINVDCDGRIERQLGTDGQVYMISEIRTPALQAAKKYRLNLALTNPYDHPILFSRISLDCGCAKFETPVDQIPPLSTEKFTMYLDVPNHTASGAARTMVRFFSDASDATPVMRLYVTYEINGVFGFPEKRVLIEIPKDENVITARLPIIITSPVTLDDLELKTSENLRDLTIQIVSDDPSSELPYIKVEAARGAIPPKGMSGEIFLRRHGTDHISGLMVMFKHLETFTIRPESIRLARENANKPYEGTAMLRVQVPLDEEKGAEVNSSVLNTNEKKGGMPAGATMPQVGLSIEGSPARVHLQKLGESGIYRLTVRYEGALEADKESTLKVQWRIVINGEERVIESHAFLPDR